MSETSLLLLSGIVWASRVDDVRWAFLSIMCWWSQVFVSETSLLLFVIHQIFVFEVDHCWWNQMFVSEISSLALVSQRVCHNCLVPGFTDGAGFLFCDDVVKTENLDWIFLLDVSLLLRLACGRISIVEYVRWFDLFGSDLLAVWLLR
jgi:hypothetical protein